MFRQRRRLGSELVTRAPVGTDMGVESRDLPPSGRSGLILGEIFGLSAGLTCTELVLVFLLFPPRLPAFPSVFLPRGVPIGEASPG